MAESQFCLTFYCQASHSGRRRGPICIGHLPEGCEAVLTCPDIECRRRYYCRVGVADQHGDLPGVQQYIGRAGVARRARPKV